MNDSSASATLELPVTMFLLSSEDNYNITVTVKVEDMYGGYSLYEMHIVVSIGNTIANVSTGWKTHNQASCCLAAKQM